MRFNGEEQSGFFAGLIDLAAKQQQAMTMQSLYPYMDNVLIDPTAIE